MLYIYGHRGARGEVPENTLASFQRCLADGVHRCELDLHLSADDELMVIHDPTLKRTTGHSGRVCSLRAAELEQLDARLAGPEHPLPCPIPRLRTLFSRCQFEHWQLEVKTASQAEAIRIVGALTRLLDEFQLQTSVTITSSSLTVLRTLQALAPDLACGLVAERAVPEPVVQAVRNNCRLLVLNWKLCTPRRLERAAEAGLEVSAWTVNDPAIMCQLAALGIHSLITDFPALARRTLGQGCATAPQASAEQHALHAR